jgi:hypothetical protein
MRFIVVMVIVCLLGGNVFAQGEVEKKAPQLSLVDLIVENEVVFELKSFDENYVAQWKALAGNEAAGLRYQLSYNTALGQKKLESLKKYYEETPKKKIKSSGNITLFFCNSGLNGNYFVDIHGYKAEFYKQRIVGVIPNKGVKFSQYDSFRDDVLWLCRNRYLLQLLKKGELTAQNYIFNPHELQFLVMVCPDTYLKRLHTYAKTQKNGELLTTLYSFMDYDVPNVKKFPLLNEKVVKNLADAIDGEIQDKVMFTNILGSFESVKKKMKENYYLTQRDKRLIRSFFINSEYSGSNQSEMGHIMKEKILANSDVETLKLYLKRMENRKSVADLVILAEFVHSKTFLEGSAEFKELIMEQFFHRKEKEVVWILAPLLKHNDKQLVERARRIMKKHTSSDLGNNPATWRAWHTEMNK